MNRSNSGFFLVSWWRELRPKQWTKNLLLFAALLFSVPDVTWRMFGLSVVGFILFCLVSSCVYIFNDLADRKVDRVHPEKRTRPIASGAIAPGVAWLVGALLTALSLTFGFWLQSGFGIILSVYFLMNLFYSFGLKHEVILDVMIIAAGFILRAVAGGLVIHVPLTNWFILCTSFLALFLAVSKRKYEWMLMQRYPQQAHRKVLQDYSPDLLNQLNSIVTTGAIMSYALFTISSDASPYLMLTLPLVIYGIFRYLYLIHLKEKGGQPEEVLLRDRPIRLTVVLYVLSVFVILFLTG